MRVSACHREEVAGRDGKPTPRLGMRLSLSIRRRDALRTAVNHRSLRSITMVTAQQKLRVMRAFALHATLYDLVNQGVLPHCSEVEPGEVAYP